MKAVRHLRQSEHVAVPGRSLRLLQPKSEKEPATSRTLIDIALYACIIAIGLFQFAHYFHFKDFLSDVTYPDLAKSIVERGQYRIRLIPETTFPPGFPLILAAVGLVLGFEPVTFYGVVAVSTILAFIASYELLRRIEGRGVAVVATLLLISSPSLFSFNTVVVYPEMTYFLASMCALVLAARIDRSAEGGIGIWKTISLGIVLVLTVLIRSVGVALLAGLASWVATSLWIKPEVGRRRFKMFVGVFLIGSAAQVAWMAWAGSHQSFEWPLPGYPRSYISQLTVRDGNHPELGYAHLEDIPSRIESNIINRAAGLSTLLTRRYVSKFWPSPAVFGTVLLVGLGVISSLRGGGQLHDWYFLWYELIFVLWPWNYADRFLVPVVPLACLYLWRGIKTVKGYATQQPRIAGTAFLVVGLILCASSAAFVVRLASLPANADHARGDRLQMLVAAVFWGIVAVVGCGMIGAKFLTRVLGGTQLPRFLPVLESRGTFAVQLVAMVVISAIVWSGVHQILAIGERNKIGDVTKDPIYPSLKAAEWIRTNQPPEQVVLAGEPEFIFHYAQRRTVWFPPISDPTVLMDGIRRNHVGLILVMHRNPSYWVPPEEECFRNVQRAYPALFRLVYEDQGAWVYQVTSPPSPSLQISDRTLTARSSGQTL
jgi:hypothetical protein